MKNNKLKVKPKIHSMVILNDKDKNNTVLIL